MDQDKASALARISEVYDVSRETEARLDAYAAELLKWTQHINLISHTSAADVWTRHILDSAQLLSHAPRTTGHWADLGSGGGLPGLVLAILMGDQPTAPHVTLVESDARKSTFLRAVARDLDLSVSVETARIERLAPLHANVITARALAPLTELFALAVPHLAEGGRLILPKGATYAAEIEAARARWRFTLTAVPSITQEVARILICEEVHLG